MGRVGPPRSRAHGLDLLGESAHLQVKKQSIRNINMDIIGLAWVNPERVSRRLLPQEAVRLDKLLFGHSRGVGY